MKHRFLLLFLPVLLSCTNLSHLSKDERADRSKNYYQEGVAARSERKFDKAEGLFRQAIRYDSSNTAAFCGIAEIFVTTEKFADAEKILLTAPTADSSYSTYYFLLGKAQFRLNKINEALRHLEWAMRLNPDQEECGFMVSQLYFQLENYRDALKILER
jgi:tetratricopeptide (TPR) repeat protein